MTGQLLAYFVGRVIDRMRFPHQEEGGKPISDRVLTMFKNGAVLGLKGGTMEECRNASRNIPWNSRAFFNEGHAMGCAGHQACSLVKRNPEATAPNNYEIMRYVGYGFWNGVRGTYPVPRITDRGSYWNNVPSSPKYRLLMENGEGFSRVMFRGEFTQKIKQYIVQVEDKRKQEALLHGVGRVLWFLYLQNYSALNRVLNENREFVESLGIGLGLAIGFTQVATPDNILQSLEQFPDEHRVHLIRGVGIAFQVHAQNDPECRENVERLVRGEMRDWYEGACRASDDAGNGEEWYPKYHELTKKLPRLAEVKI